MSQIPDLEALLCCEEVLPSEGFECASIDIL